MNIWNKMSIFFYLPYWFDLHVCHCLDVIHVKKNECDSLIGTFLNIKGKIKDGLKGCEDLVDMGMAILIANTSTTFHKDERLENTHAVHGKCNYEIEMPEETSSPS